MENSSHQFERRDGKMYMTFPPELDKVYWLEISGGKRIYNSNFTGSPENAVVDKYERGVFAEVSI